MQLRDGDDLKCNHPHHAIRKGDKPEGSGIQE